jgi:hypothetical protein
MTLEDIVNALPSREDIAAAAGLQARRSVSGDLASALSIFAAGIILGAGLALLFAPKAGEEIRRELAERVGDVGSRLYGNAPATESPST